MPFSFSNIGASALLFMLACLTIAEIVKQVKKNYHHSKK